MIRIIVMMAAVLSMNQAAALSLNHKCEPNGLITKGKEAWNPKGFWTTQLKEIEEYVKWVKADYRLSQIERKRERINEKLDDEEMKAMGITQDYYPGLDRELKQMERESIQFEKSFLENNLNGRVSVPLMQRGSYPQIR